jgi:class 3 adenylate cyclase
VPDEATPPDDAQPALERRLATILSADVAGYSRMMGEHEEATVQALRGHRAVFDALLKQHHGRIFNTAGDAVLAEFPSAVEAVRCATEIQSALQTRNEHLPPEQKMQFRMGINVGDVVVQEGDLLGDGVNVAARIQTVADPGGICISGSVYDQIQNKLSLQFKPLGEQQFKNIGQRIRTFTITHGERGALPASLRRPGAKSAIALGVGVIAAAALAAGGYALYRDYEAKRLEQSALSTQLASEKQAAEEARRVAGEQSRRAIEAEGRAERERLVAEAAKREAALQAQVQSAEDARRRSEAERKRLDDERQRAEADKRAAAARAEEEKRVAAARVEEEKRAAEARAEETKRKRPLPALAMAAGGRAAATGSRQPASGDSKQVDGDYDGLLCNVPKDPSKKACWQVALKVQNGAATASWPNRMIGKTAYAHVAIEQGGVAKLALDGWNVREGTPLTGTMTGHVVDNHIDAEGRWANGVRVEGHWTRAP